MVVFLLFCTGLWGVLEVEDLSRAAGVFGGFWRVLEGLGVEKRRGSAGGLSEGLRPVFEGCFFFSDFEG